MPQPRRRRGGRWANQAALEALLRFGPEQSGLAELQLAAQQQFTTGVRQANAGRRAIGQAISAARPDVRAIYNRADDRVGNINAVLGDSMAAAPASLQAAMAQEQAGFGRRLEESRADALTGLKERRIAAREGEVTAVRAARDEFAGTLAQIMRRKLDLAREQGTFTALRTGELRQAARERADQFAMQQAELTQSERNSLRSAGIDPNTGQAIPGGRLDPDANNRPGDQSDGKGNKGRGWASQEQHAAAQDMVDLAIREAATLRKAAEASNGRVSREEIADLLTSGADDQEIALHDPQTGRPLYNKDGTPKTRRIPGVPQIKSQTLLDAALDMAFLGYITPKNYRRLRARRLRVADLPSLTTYRDWRRALGQSGPVQTGGT